VTHRRHSAVQNSDREVSAKVAVARAVRSRIAWHGHVQPGQNTSDAGMGAKPVGHDEALEPQLTLEQVIKQVGVLAGL